MKLKDTKQRSDLTVTVGSGKAAKTAISDSLSYDKLGRIDGWSINASDYADLNSIAGTSETIYTYDKLGRLIKAEDKGRSRTWEYTYDAIGNITSSIFTDKEGVHEDTYTYDRDNLTRYNGEKVDGYKGGNPKNYLGNTLTWARGRQLMSVTPAKKRSEYSAEDTVTFTYAYDGSRLSKTVGQTKKNSGTTTEYVLNGSTILAQNTTYPDGSKETLNFYYSSDGKLLEIGYLKGDDNGNISKDAVETHYSVIRNAMGDVAAIYIADRTLVGTYEYDPYGLPLAVTSNPEYSDTIDILHKNPFRYRGYYYDKETKWYYLQSRYYDPQVKRFINADSTDLLTSDCSNLMQYNMFMYCNGDPVNIIDPNGHIGVEATLGIGAAISAIIEMTSEIAGAVAAFAPYAAVAILVAGAITIGIQIAKSEADSQLDDGSKKETDGRIDDLLNGAKEGNKTKGKSKQYEKEGGIGQANDDFDNILKPQNEQEIRERKGTIRTGVMPDGSKVDVRDVSTDGRATVEIIRSNGRRIKVRYDVD